MTRRAVVLLGPPGAGKSTAGRLAAEALGWSFADLDEAIGAARGASVDDVFREGEPLFRSLELFHLPPLLRGVRLVACGAGVVDGLRARSLLAAHPCVLLDVAPEQALTRLQGARPWLAEAEHRAARYRAREEPRRAVRMRLARAHVAGDGALPDVVAALVRTLARLG